VLCNLSGRGDKDVHTIAAREGLVVSALLRNSGVLLLALGWPRASRRSHQLAPAAKATTQPAQQPAANDDLDPMARTPIVDPPPWTIRTAMTRPRWPRWRWTMPARC
jgi:hypothetical protein